MDSDSVISDLLFSFHLVQSTSITISPSPGHYTTAEYIKITAASGTKIYFTTDGTEPTSSSYEYTEPIHIWKLAGAQITAIAVKNGFTIARMAQSDYYSYPNVKTGSNLCFSGTGTPQACSGTGEDGEFQNGVSRAYTGPTANAKYPNDYTTTDEATGLIWRSCTQGQSGASCTGAVITQDWTSAQTGTNGCNALNSMNSGEGYAGRKDWRLPQIDELRTIVDFTGKSLSPSTPSINSSAFPNTPAGSVNIGTYWSITDSATGLYPFNVNFSTGLGDYNSINQLTPLNVRCVAGFQSARVFQFTDNGDLTVTDHRTRLIWQKCSNGLTGSSCIGTTINLQWPGSLTNCNTLNLSSRKWRLPSMNELTGFQNFIKFDINPRVDLNYFPNTLGGSGYWTSSTDNYTNANKLLVLTNGNFGSYAGGSNSASIRCVSN